MTAPLSDLEGARLAGLAVATVAARLCGHALRGAAPREPALRARGATFVTLRSGGRLRGCVGSLEPRWPRYQDVIHNAGAAMRDPRLPAVTTADWPELEVHVSVLSPAEPVPATTRDQLLATLQPGTDGLVLAAAGRRVTFLPAVWEQLTTGERFVAALLTKGGWPASAWPAGLSATATRWSSSAPTAPAVRRPTTSTTTTPVAAAVSRPPRPEPRCPEPRCPEPPSHERPAGGAAGGGHRWGWQDGDYDTPAGR